ncbi:MAG TPA: hypothetical protein VE994_09965 [Terriglobales bacterium]|nr:hypothetical protein [Terriglobales bacterium]
MTRRIAIWILAFATMLGVSAIAFAQQPADKDITQSEMRNFDQYLDKHQDVRSDLSKNPNLINDPNYLAKHPHLKAFLEEHPNTRQELKENPSAFMKSEGSYEKAENGSQAGISQAELRNWDAYLDQHKDVKADLSKNPGLIDDPNYLAKHPHLKAFLEQHPNTRAQLKAHPEKFMNREKAYESSEKDHKHK